jgi:hypothetical protein
MIFRKIGFQQFDFIPQRRKSIRAKTAYPYFRGTIIPGQVIFFIDTLNDPVDEMNLGVRVGVIYSIPVTVFPNPVQVHVVKVAEVVMTINITLRFFFIE